MAAGTATGKAKTGTTSDETAAPFHGRPRDLLLTAELCARPLDFLPTADLRGGLRDLLPNAESLSARTGYGARILWTIGHSNEASSARS